MAKPNRALDWHRSSFFNINTESLDPIATPDTNHDDDENDSHDEFDIDFGDNDDHQPQEESEDDIKEEEESDNNQQTESEQVSDNPIMNELIRIMMDRFEHLVERGFLNESFLIKIRNDPNEILRFIRQNRAVVGDQLNRRLNPTIRPTPQKLEKMGIVPKGYFKHGHQGAINAMARKHRRKSTATQDLAALIQLRPKPEQMVAKGIVERSDMERYIELDDKKLEQHELGYSIKDAMRSNLMEESKEEMEDEVKERENEDGQEQKYDNNNTNHHNMNMNMNINNNEYNNAESDMNRNGRIINQLQEENANDQRASQMEEVNEYYGPQSNYNQQQQSSTMQQQQTWEISILNTLLFKTIAEALRKSCLDTQKQEALVLLQMEEMNNEMKHLRDALDKYFLNDEPDVLLFQKEEEMIRDKFHGIQKKLLNISTKQNSIHEKLRILHSVEKKMIDLQNIYDQQLGQLRKKEEEILKDLREQRIRREKAIKIRIAEKSHSNWAMAKLDYTISIAQKNKIDDDFINHLGSFLTKLRSISQNQNNTVRDFDFAIDKLENALINIRHNMSKVRTMTFKKIYDLHKQVEIAESLELGNRRLSVASATEIERERRHHTTKIQRQLSTLKNQIKIFNYVGHEKNMREIIDVQLVMSDNKMKSFFSVFTQCFSQTICDIDLCYQNLNCLIDDDKEDTNMNQSEQDSYSKTDELGMTSSSSNSSDEDADLMDLYAQKNKHNALQTIHDENKIKIRKLCMELYGVTNVLQKISLHGNSSSIYKTKKRKDDDLSLVEKIIHCMKFVQISKNALLYEIQKAYYQMNNLNGGNMTEFNGANLRFTIDTVKTNEIVLIIGRKLTIDTHMLDDIDITSDEQIPSLAQARVRNVFEAIIRAQDLTKIFSRKPLSSMQVASAILNYVFGIENHEENDSYFN